MKPRSSKTGTGLPSVQVSRKIASVTSTGPRSSPAATRSSIQNEPRPIDTSTMRSSSPSAPSISHLPASSISMQSVA